METVYINQLVDALQALYEDNGEGADTLFEHWPVSAENQAEDYDVADFSGDRACLFNEGLIDFFHANEERFESENPKIYAILDAELFNVLDAFVPMLKSDEPDDWAIYRKDLKELCKILTSAN